MANIYLNGARDQLDRALSFGDRAYASQEYWRVLEAYKRSKANSTFASEDNEIREAISYIHSRRAEFD